MFELPNEVMVSLLSRKKDKKMPSIVPLKTNRQLHQGPAGCAIRVCPDDCKPAYLDINIERGLVPNCDRTWQTGRSYVALSIIQLYTKSKSKKLDMDREVFARDNNDIAFCSRISINQMRNKIRGSLTTVYQT